MIMDRSTNAVAGFSELDNEALGAAITRHAASVNSAQCRLLKLVCEFESRRAWHRDGMRSCAHWLNLHCGIALGAAREKVRVALALKCLPGILSAFETGRLSYSKVRALTRIASRSNEDALLVRAQHCSASELEKDIRLRRRHKDGIIERPVSAPAHQNDVFPTASDSAEPDPPNHSPDTQSPAQVIDDQYMKRSLDTRWDDEGFLIIRAKLCPDQGALVLKSIEAAAESLRAESLRNEAPVHDSNVTENCPRGDNEKDTDQSADFHSVPEETFEANPPAWFGRRANRRADALVLLAETHLQNINGISTQSDRYQVVVHVEQQVLANAVDPANQDRPDCLLEDETGIPVETARRLSCDSKLVAMLKDGGEPLAVSRRSRSIPSAMRRALSERDKGCRFPGCTAFRYVDGHHIVHWAEGGETSLHNLVTLCRHHHRLVHEGGFQVLRTNGSLRFADADGRILGRSQHHDECVLSNTHGHAAADPENQTRQCAVSVSHSPDTAKAAKAAEEHNTTAATPSAPPCSPHPQP